MISPPGGAVSILASPHIRRPVNRLPVIGNTGKAARACDGRVRSAQDGDRFGDGCVLVVAAIRVLGQRRDGGPVRWTFARQGRRRLAEWAARRRGVEVYVEPKTAVTGTSVVLVAHDGEFTRRRISSPKAAQKFAHDNAVADLRRHDRRLPAADARLLPSAEHPARARPAGGARRLTLPTLDHGCSASTSARSASPAPLGSSLATGSIRPSTRARRSGSARIGGRPVRQRGRLRPASRRRTRTGRCAAGCSGRRRQVRRASARRCRPGWPAASGPARRYRRERCSRRAFRR